MRVANEYRQRLCPPGEMSSLPRIGENIQNSSQNVERRRTISNVALKQFPAYLNRWDSQQARNEGVFAH